MNQPQYKPCDYRNNSEAFGRFQSTGVFSSARYIVSYGMAHKITGGIIAVMGAIGVVALIMFWG